jgi:hypothetical protein
MRVYDSGLPEWFYWLVIAGLVGFIVWLVWFLWKLTRPKKRHKTSCTLTVK